MESDIIDMDIELTEAIQYYLVNIPEKDLSITVSYHKRNGMCIGYLLRYIENDSSVTGEWDFIVDLGDEEDLTEEIKNEIKSKLKLLTNE